MHGPPCRTRALAASILALLCAAPPVDAQSTWDLGDTDFERGLPRQWSVEGGVRVRGSQVDRASYWGRRALELGRGSVRMVLRLGVGTAGGAPRVGDEPELAAWVVLDDAAGGAPGASFALRVESRDAATRRWMGLAAAEWSAGPGERERWRYLRTEPLAGAGSIPAGSDSLRLVIEKRGSVARLDLVEAGLVGATDGLPARLALASYASWYRSPLSSDATGQGTTSKELWQNWAWIDPPLCDPTDRDLLHDPECSTNPDCMRANGRRDAAVSVLDGLDRLPLAGTYDSRDRDLLRYHAELAESIGLDVLVFDWYGHLLAEQSALAGEVPIATASLSRLIDQAETRTDDLKVALMLEPKVHMSEWVAGEPSFAEKMAGIVEDIVRVIDEHGRRRALLRHRGAPVLFVFGHRSCTSAGDCLDDDDWSQILSAVRAATGESPWLVSTETPDAASPAFGGMMRWGLVAPSILRFSSWSDFVLGLPKYPPATLLDVLAHAELVNDIAADWAALAPGRSAAAIVWPGFDDSGVAGWSGSHGTGSDDGPLCVRVVEDPGGGFLSTTLAAALLSGLDWLHVCTFNDWNEGTAIEPRWNALYAADVAAARASRATTLAAVFGRALETQAGLRAFLGPRGSGLAPETIERAARRYLQATLRGDATAYD